MQAKRGGQGTAATYDYDKDGQHHTLDTLAPAHTWYPLYRWLGWHQGRPGQHGNENPTLPRFNPQTIQPTTRRYSMVF